MSLRRHFTQFTVTASALLAVTAVGAPADAATTQFRDRAGDAPARWDLTSIQVTNGTDLLTTRAHVRALRAGGTQVFGVLFDKAGTDWHYAVYSVRRTSGRVITRMLRYDSTGAAGAVVCSITSRWPLALHRVVVKIPQQCLGESGAVRVNVAIGKGNGAAGDPADWTRRVWVAYN